MLMNAELQRLIQDGILEPESLQSFVKMKIKEKIVCEHKYAISQISDGRWLTYYVPKGETKRKPIKASTREALEDKLVELYEGEQHNKNITLNTVYLEWLDYKRMITNSQNTIVRHEQHYRKYLKDSALFNKPLENISIIELRAFCNDIVKRFNLTSKEWTNVKTVINGIFEYAVDKELLISNPLQRVKITVKFRQPKIKQSCDEVFNVEEQAEFQAYMSDRFDRTHDVRCLGLLLNFYLGLRIGELVALRWEDLIDNTLVVCKEESLDKSINCTVILDHTKTNRARTMPLVPAAIELLERIKSYTGSCEYIFSNASGERYTARQFQYILEKYAKDTGSKVKRTHTIRRTTASKLENAGTPLNVISRFLGHSNLTTTMAYLYNQNTDAQTYDLLTKAL